VVVATRNRARYLRRALQSLVNQSLSNELYEIIVVDNGSQDETTQVVDGFAVANLSYIYEPVAGVSRARNVGWHRARGAYIAFLDDDAVACTGWLAKILEVFETTAPLPGAVGGKCEGIWEAPRPDWLANEMLGFLSVIDLSDVPIVFDDYGRLSVCNMAVPRAVLERAGGFREDLGRQGTTLRANPEVSLQKQLAALGLKTVYHPQILVGHHVAATRLNKKWFRQRAYWQGLSDVVMADPTGSLSFVDRVHLALVKIGWALPRLGLMLVVRHPGDRFRRQCQVLSVIGLVDGLFRSRPSRQQV
jgi:glucosyl-dolichyl phosphate glucuronosyltransferase